MKNRNLFLFALILTTLSFSQAFAQREFVNYKSCTEFGFSEKSNDCHFLKELNNGAKYSQSDPTKSFYITRYLNSSTGKTVGYDIANLNPDESIEGREFESLEIDYSKKLDSYIVYLEKNVFNIVVAEFWD